MVNEVLKIGIGPKTAQELVQTSIVVGKTVEKLQLLANDSSPGAGHQEKVDLTNAIKNVKSAPRGEDAIRLMNRISPLMYEASCFNGQLGSWPTLAFYYYTD